MERKREGKRGGGVEEERSERRRVEWRSLKRRSGRVRGKGGEERWKKERRGNRGGEEGEE